MIYTQGLDRWQESQGLTADNTKVYVNVTAEFTSDGILRPLMITWEDGRKYLITQVKDSCRAASRKAGGAGIRYVCQIGRTQCNLYYEENYRWFVERKGQECQGA